MATDPNPTSAPKIDSQYLAKVLAWISEHGDLVDFDCPNHLPPILFREMRDRRLIQKKPGRGLGYSVTSTGEALMEVINAHR